MNRRRFIRSVGATGLAVTTLPTVVDSFAVQALAGGDPRLQQLLEAQDRILVLIQLPGGNDGLNTIIPYTNDLYYQRRPNIAIAKNKALRLNDTLGWHPVLGGMRDVFEQGKMAVIQGVTYPNPDRSHFRGTDIWLTATDADVFGTTGWVGRYLQTMAPNYPTELPEHPLAIQIGTSMSLGLLGPNGAMGISFRDPDEFYRMVNSGGAVEEVPSSVTGDTPAGREVSFMRDVARASDIYAKVVKAAADSAPASTVTYTGSDLAAKLKVVAQLIAGGMKTRVYLVSYTGNSFDTHAGQTAASDATAGVHANLLREMSDGVSAFMTDMQNLGHADRIAGMTFSEFGRRVAENGSIGTDHGTAAPLFVFGNDVRGGVYGKDPDLVNLDNRGDLLMEYDYRDIYASVLLQWFGTGSSVAQQVLFKDFGPSAMNLFKSAPTSVNDDVRAAHNVFRSVTPNPAVDYATVRVNVDAYASSVGLTLSDMTGRQLRTAEVDAWSGTGTISVQGLSAGTYILTLHADRTVAHTFVHVAR